MRIRPKYFSIIEKIIYVYIFGMVSYFVVRFGFIDSFKLWTLLPLFLTPCVGTYSRWSLKFNLIDKYVLCFALYSIFITGPLTLMNSSAFIFAKGFRTTVLEVLTYFIVRMYLDYNPGSIRRIPTFFLVLCTYVVTYNLADFLNFSVLKRDYFFWVKNMIVRLNIGLENESLRNITFLRAPGILADPHASGLAGSMCSMYIFIYSIGQMIRSKLYYILFFLGVVGVLTSSYRTTVLGSIILILLISFIYKRVFPFVFVACSGCILGSVFFFRNSFLYVEKYIAPLFTLKQYQSSFEYIILMGLDHLAEIAKVTPVLILTGLGFVSKVKVDYSLGFYTNDTAWAVYIEYFGIIGFSIFLLPLAYMTFILKSRIRSAERELASVYVATYSVVFIGFFSILHSDVLKTNGVFTLFYVAMGIFASLENNYQNDDSGKVL